MPKILQRADSFIGSPVIKTIANLIHSNLIPYFCTVLKLGKMKYLVIVFFFVTCCTLQLSVAQERIVVDEEAQILIEKSQEIIYTNPEQAVYYATQAIQLTSKGKRADQKNDQRAEAVLAFGLAERFLGNFDSSIKMLYEALEYVSPHNLALRGKIYSLMGVVYCSLTDYNTAIDYNDKATSLFKTIGDSASIAASYNNRGIIHYSLGEFNIAERFLQRALKMNRSLKLIKEVAANLNNLALYNGDYKEKLDFINEAIVINKNLNAQWALGENFNNLGKQYFYAKKYDQALEALSKAEDIATSIGAKDLIADNCEYSSWVYAAKGDYRKAYESQNKLSSLNKERQSSNKLRSIEQDISNKRLQKQKAASEKIEQEYEIELLRLNIFILVVVFILLIVISIFLTKWNRRKRLMELMNARYLLEQSERQVAELKIRQQELELETAQDTLINKRKEITAFAIFLQSRNELLDKIRDMIKKGYRMNESEMVKHLKKMNLFIAQYQSTDKDSSTVLMNVEERNQEFLQRLSNQHPNLTEGEKNLALLLCINLSTKEISLLTGKNPKTINMNRYRLRKSLNLTPNDSLTEYIQNI